MTFGQILLTLFIGSVWGWVNNALADMAPFWGEEDTSNVLCSNCGTKRGWKSMLLYHVKCLCDASFPRVTRRYITHFVGITLTLFIFMSIPVWGARSFLLLVYASLYISFIVDLEHRIALVGYLFSSGVVFWAGGYYIFGIKGVLTGVSIATIPLLAVLLVAIVVARTTGSDLTALDMLGGGDYIFAVAIGGLFGLNMIDVWFWTAAISIVVFLFVMVVNKCTEKKIETIPFISVLSVAGFCVLLTP